MNAAAKLLVPLIICLTVLLSVACQPVVKRQPAAAAMQANAASPVLIYTERLADQLFIGLGPIQKGAIAVVSFTELKSLAPDPYNLSLNLLGLQFQESMIAVASQRGYQVKELRLAKAVSVYPDHERQLSRDLAELATQQSVRYVIVGTLNQSEFYTTVNARLVDIQTNSVIAAASDVVPAEVLGSSEQLQLRQQKLYRTSAGN